MMTSYSEITKSFRNKAAMMVRKIFFLAFLTSIPLSLYSIDFPARSNKLVNDYAGILNSAQINNLERKLVAFDDSTSNQVTIVTVADLQGYDVADYAVRLGNAWGVGQNAKKNGIVFLVAPNERKVTIQTGYGLEPVLPDIIAGRIIREQIAPEFRNGNYYEGIDKAVDAIIFYTGSEFTAEPREDNTYVLLLLIFAFLVILLLFAYFTRNAHPSNRQIIRGDGHPWYGDPWGGNPSSRGRSSGGNWGGWGGGGWGGGSSGGGGGGFGGFGGGSFGGGGASGSW